VGTKTTHKSSSHPAWHSTGIASPQSTIAPNTRLKQGNCCLGCAKHTKRNPFTPEERSRVRKMGEGESKEPKKRPYYRSPKRIAGRSASAAPVLPPTPTRTRGGLSRPQPEHKKKDQPEQSPPSKRTPPVPTYTHDLLLPGRGWNYDRAGNPDMRKTDPGISLGFSQPLGDHRSQYDRPLHFFRKCRTFSKGPQA